MRADPTTIIAAVSIEMRTTIPTLAMIWLVPVARTVLGETAGQIGLIFGIQEKAGTSGED